MSIDLERLSSSERDRLLETMRNQVIGGNRLSNEPGMQYVGRFRVDTAQRVIDEIHKYEGAYDRIEEPDHENINRIIEW